MLTKIKKHIHLLAAFAIPLFSYIVTLSPDVLPGDSGEFQALIPIGGVLHSSGYPLYLLTGKLFTLILPLGNYAWRLNLLSAVFSALMAAAIAAMLSECGFSKVFSSSGGILLALSPMLWRQSIIAEVYALSALLLSLLWLFGCKSREKKNLIPVLSLVAGLSLTHHLILVAAIPWPFLILKRRGYTARMKLISILTFLSPLLLYAVIPLNAARWFRRFPGTLLGFPEAVVRGYVSPAWMGGFWKYVIAYNYTSPSNFSRLPSAKTIASMSMHWITNISAEYSAVGLALALLGTVWLYKKRSPLLTFTVPTFLAVSAFSSLYSWRYHEETGFLVIAVLSAGIWIASGIEALWQETHGWKRVVPALLALAILTWEIRAFQNSPAYWTENPGNGHTPRRWAEAALVEAEPNSVIFGSWGLITPLRYLQFVEHQREDVVVVHAPLGDRQFMASLIEEARESGRKPYLLLPDPHTGGKLLPAK